MSPALDDNLLCGRFRRRPPQLGSGAPPRLRPFDAMLPVTDEVSGRNAWLLPIPASFVGSEVDKSYFMMGATKAMQLSLDLAITPAFVDRDEQWFWIGYWADDLVHHPLKVELCRAGGIVHWASGVARSLAQLHGAGKQHGLLQTDSVVRDDTGQIRLWGGALYDLFHKGRLAEKAKDLTANSDVFFVPALVEASPLSIHAELHGWAMAVASRWFDVSGSKTVPRLASEECDESWARELKQLLNNCLTDPAANGICSLNDVVARLDVIVQVMPELRERSEQRLQEFVPLDASMPSLESVSVGLSDKRGQTAAPTRPVTSANTGAVHLGSEAMPQARGVGSASPSSNRPWIWLGVISLAVCATVAGVWAYTAGVGPFGGAGQALPEQASSEPQEKGDHGDLEVAQRPAPAAPAGPGPCPKHAARLPGGSCMDRFEYPGEGKLPRVSLTKNQASLLCEARQGRLCSTLEWRSACMLGKANLAGCQLRAGAKGRTQLRLSSKSDCSHAGRFYDLLGNAAEWVQDGSALGGDAKTTRAKTTCMSSLSAKQALGFMVGFRCCYGSVDAGKPSAQP